MSFMDHYYDQHPQVSSYTFIDPEAKKTRMDQNQSNHALYAVSPTHQYQQQQHYYGQWPYSPPSFPAQQPQPVAGSLDPTTGVFYRTPEHPRLRTAQACGRCRVRKAKCSGEHPSCQRCITRGLICEYAKEGRVRGPNKPKTRIVALVGPQYDSPIHSPVSATFDDSTQNQRFIPTNVPPLHESRSVPNFDAARGQSMSASYSGEARSFGNRSSRPRPPDLRLEQTSNLFRVDGRYMDDPQSMPSSRDWPDHPQQVYAMGNHENMDGPTPMHEHAQGRFFHLKSQSDSGPQMAGEVNEPQTSASAIFPSHNPSHHHSSRHTPYLQLDPNYHRHHDLSHPNSPAPTLSSSGSHSASGHSPLSGYNTPISTPASATFDYHARHPLEMLQPQPAQNIPWDTDSGQEYTIYVQHSQGSLSPVPSHVESY